MNRTNQLIANLLRLSRIQKRLIQVAVDCALIVTCFVLAMLLRLESWSFIFVSQAWYAMVLTIPVSILIFIKLGFYRQIIRYVGSNALYIILFGVAASAAILATYSLLFPRYVPRSVPLIYFPMAFLTVGGIRLAARSLLEFSLGTTKAKNKLLIYGAGDTGQHLARSLRQGTEFEPVGYLDDSARLHNMKVAGYPVYDPSTIEKLVGELGITNVLLSMPEASRQRRAEIIAGLEQYPIKVQTIPRTADLVTGKAKVTEVREVFLEDLLGREAVAPQEELMNANIRGQVVLVTGAGGSIGSELCRQILAREPETILLLDSSESALYLIDQELQAIVGAKHLSAQVVPLLGSVRDHGRLGIIFRRYEIATVFHAAAYKHVPMVEHNVIEGIRNNTFGTLAIVDAAAAGGVKAFILISTDKAVRPTNVMGASKRIAELICQAKQIEHPDTRFSIVRFGNVLGSSGSVIPLFRKQILHGGPVTVTDPEVTRFFMAIPEAAQLVIQAGAIATGGDVFLLNMGKPINIDELAARMIKLSGFQPYRARSPSDVGPVVGEIKIIYTGLRPGEKKHEELLVSEVAQSTVHPKIVSAVEKGMEWQELKPILNELLLACNGNDLNQIRKILQSLSIEYEPASEQVDYIKELEHGDADKDVAARLH